jgi:hypothetical protein
MASHGSMYGPLPSDYAKLSSASDYKREDARRAQSALAQIRESNKGFSDLRARTSSTRSANSNRGIISDNIRTTGVALKDQRAYLAEQKAYKRETNRLDKISEASAKEERLARQKIAERERTSSLGGYSKLTKMGLLARIMNIKKKAAKAAKAAKAKAKPVVRKAKPAAKRPVAKRVAKPKRA